MNEIINGLKNTVEYQDIIKYFMVDATTAEQASDGTIMFEVPFKRDVKDDIIKNSNKGFFIIYSTGHLRYYDAISNHIRTITQKVSRNKPKQYIYLFNILINAFKSIAGREPDFLQEMETLNNIPKSKYPLYIGQTWKYDIFKKEFIDRLSGKKTF